MATSATTQPDSSALDDLPQEVLIRIASFLTTAELGPFRRTCQQIETKLFNTFANEFFTKRQFMLEHESLDALIGISRHPGLAAKLTEVIIGTQTLSAGVGLVHDRILHGRLTRDVLLQTGAACEMLAEAFSKLPNLRCVGLRDYDGAGRFRDGLNARWRSWGWSFGFRGALQDPGQVLPVLLTALGRAQARPTNIEVILRRLPHLPFDSFLLPPTASGQSIRAVLAETNTLMLSIGGGAGTAADLAPWATYNDHNSFEAPLRQFLHTATNLQSLRLNFVTDQFMGQRSIEWLSRPVSATSGHTDILHTPSVQLAALNSLEFGMANVPGDVLVRALTKFNLKSISLWKMTLQCPAPDSLASDCWADFLKQLSAALPPTSPLRYISIGAASQYHYTPSQPRSHNAAVATKFVPEGTAETEKAKASKDETIAFKAQFTNKSAQQWLRDMADLTFVPGIHSSPSSSPVSIDSSDSEDLAESEDEDDEDV
ncbi:hypothetical protein CLAFUW4_02147 [Fulvia fulva]|uniref:F-box domain-containing protein n=1 Tax=Passalora fulva TaxID=5499 RepID=A0A9Q8L4Z4_PASFU|nr:uncharacterized protein CLAFUR5_02138 [Fulvia fulva]UJO10970.1 hypothetical protein CLAFUR5_02138 [Fulvia fulva]WPV10102.1 hypothetical protein CLAFUW4_02147 [Fulvia fulva]